MKETNQIDSLLINSTITEGTKTTYELKLLDATSEEINITYDTSTGCYSDDGYTLYHLSMLRNSAGKKGLPQEMYNQIQQMAKGFGVSLVDSELIILKGNDSPRQKHYEMANLLNCIVAINTLIKFTTLFD